RSELSRVGFLGGRSQNLGRCGGRAHDGRRFWWLYDQYCTQRLRSNCGCTAQTTLLRKVWAEPRCDLYSGRWGYAGVGRIKKLKPYRSRSRRCFKKENLSFGATSSRSRSAAIPSCNASTRTSAKEAMIPSTSVSSKKPSTMPYCKAIFEEK